jgi:hypothetical protein
MKLKLRKPQARRTGLKVMVFGPSGTGKSRYSLSGWKNQIVVDSEAKIGVIEGNEKYTANIVGILDSSNYYDVTELMEEIIKDTSMCDTLVVDSETNIYNSTQIACLQVEENRAKKRKGEVEDAALSQRAWGRIKNNYTRAKLLRQQLSSQGVTIISVAQSEPIMQQVGTERVVVGYKPIMAKSSEFEYDVILHFQTERDMATGEIKYFCDVEKDATDTFKVGTRIYNPTYENTYKSYVESNKSLETVKMDYSKAIDKEIARSEEDNKNHEDLVEEFVALFKDMKAKDPAKSSLISDMLKEHGIDSYKKPEHFEALQTVVVKMKQM